MAKTRRRTAGGSEGGAVPSSSRPSRRTRKARSSAGPAGAAEGPATGATGVGATPADRGPEAAAGRARPGVAPPDRRPEVVLYADGACRGNPGPGGWGAILVNPRTGNRLEISGADPDTTNNRMELIAIIEGLRRLKRASRVRIVTDSRYVVDGMKGWIHHWRRNGWKTADRKPVKNRDLWEELAGFERAHQLRFEWIRGHEGHVENERCDQMAVEACRNLERLRRGPTGAST